MATVTGVSGTIKAEYVDIRVMVNLHAESNTPPLHMLEKRNKHFFGRDDKIKEIKEAIEEMKEETDSFRRTIVLLGFGGMGKSETAKVFAETFSDMYDYIVWIDSETEQSVEASFRELAGRMEMEFRSLADVPKIQAKIAKCFKNGLFIFDNAEGLTTTETQFGIENLLFNKFPNNKPIFLATSRNGRSLWGGTRNEVKFISIDRLSDEESTEVLKNYLFVQGLEIPTSLEDAISSLVKTLGGYPLGLSLVGSTIVEKAEKISLDETVSRIELYTEILKDVPLGEVSGELNYKAALELIYNQTVKKISAREYGSIAVELLNIMASLNPDGLYLGLINAIYGGTTCETKRENEVTNQNVKKGLVILKDYSIVKIDNWKRSRIHRLIQQCASKTQVCQEVLSKIRTFFEHNEKNGDWGIHIGTLFYMLTTEGGVDNAEYFLCLLLWRSDTRYWKDHLLKCKSYFNKKSSPEPTLFTLADIYYNLRYSLYKRSVNWEEIETNRFWTKRFWTNRNIILNLSQDLRRRVWVIGALLKFLQLKMPLRRERYNSFIISCCMEFTNEKLGILITEPCNLLITIYGKKSTRNVSGDSAFLKKIFDCPPKELRTYLWKTSLDEHLTTDDKHSLNGIFKVFGPQWFTDSLKFTNDEEKHDLCKSGFYRYLGNLLNVWEKLKNSDKFIKYPEFVNAFMDFAKFYLETIVLDYEYPEDTFFRISFVVISLFDADKMVCDNCNSRIEPAFQNALKELKQKCKSNRRFVLYMLSEEIIGSRLKDFHVKVENCLWKPKWATDFLEFLTTPALEALFLGDYDLSELLEDSYVIQLYNLENCPEEERQDRFLDKIFNKWGVDGFTAALNFRDNTKKYNWKDIRLFGNYLENLLRIWKTPGNFETFAKSPDFVNALIREEKLVLENISFYSVWDLNAYLRLSTVVIWLFDADEKIYDEFNVSLKPLFEKSLNRLKQRSKTDPKYIPDALKWNIAKVALKEFQQKIENCNRKPTWALKLLEFINSESTGESENDD